MRAGGTPSTSEERFWAEPGDGIPWVSIGDMSSGKHVDGTERAVTDEGIEAKRLPVGGRGTLLFAMYASVGLVAALETRASWNQALLGIESLPGRSDVRFVRFWLEHLRPSLLALSRSNTQDNLNAEQVANLPFPLLDLRIQTGIADFLDYEIARINALIAKKRRMIELIGERRMASVVAGVAGRLSSRTPRRESTLSWLDSIPEHWHELGLTLVARLGSGHTPSRRRAD